jgi:pilus assembly protein Flp/PilA
MTAVRRMLRTLVTDERGATAIEYGLIAALIVVAMVAALGSLGGGTMGMWTKINNAVQNT